MPRVLVVPAAARGQERRQEGTRGAHANLFNSAVTVVNKMANTITGENARIDEETVGRAPSPKAHVNNGTYMMRVLSGPAKFADT
jgi:hypothetical protein